MLYAEAAFFDGVHVAHIAAWQEHKRKVRLARLVSADHRFPVIARELRAKLEA